MKLVLVFRARLCKPFLDEFAGSGCKSSGCEALWTIIDRELASTDEGFDSICLSL